MMDHSGSRFTLLNLLFCLIFGALLMAIGIPALVTSRAAARQTLCSNNLMQLGIALHTYHDTYAVFPHNGVFFETRQSRNPYTWEQTARGSVFVKLLPFIEEDPLYNGLSFELAGKKGAFLNQKHQGKAIKDHAIPTLFCPATDLSVDIDGKAGGAISCYSPSLGSQRMDSRGNWCLDYPGNYFGTGPANHGNTMRAYRVSGTFARGAWGAKFRDITDGQSQVIAMGEIRANKSDHHSLGWASHNSLWTATTAPINYPVRGIGESGFPGAADCSHYQNIQTSQGFKSTHIGGAMFLMADGNVVFLTDTIDYMTYQRLGDRRDGQPVEILFTRQR